MNIAVRIAPFPAGIIRGRFNEITNINGRPAAETLKRFEPALPPTFAEFDKAKRGDALNVDLYGLDPEQDVAVVQVRHSFRRYRNGFLNTHIDYVLVGFNELTGLPFRHPVSAYIVRAAIRRNPSDPVVAVRAAQRWMWSVTERQLTNGVRQGDVLLVPERGQPRPVKAELGVNHVVGGSHEIRAARIVELQSGRVWALSPSVWHAKGQHDPIFADHDGWHSVRVADEAPTWRWGQRLGD